MYTVYVVGAFLPLFLSHIQTERKEKHLQMNRCSIDSYTMIPWCPLHRIWCWISVELTHTFFISTKGRQTRSCGKSSGYQEEYVSRFRTKGVIKVVLIGWWVLLSRFTFLMTKLELNPLARNSDVYEEHEAYDRVYVHITVSRPNKPPSLQATWILYAWLPLTNLWHGAFVYIGRAWNL